MPIDIQNPFRPNALLHPGMFVGRSVELEAIENCLRQTCSGNSQSFLIYGERGFGKSSLLWYIHWLATGKIKGKNNHSFRFITANVDLSRCTSEADVVNAIARSIKRSLAENHKIKETARRIIEWLANWEAMGVRYKKSNDRDDFEDILENLLIQIAQFTRENSNIVDGLLILMDEADSPSGEANIGRILKYMCERLNRLDCTNVVFGLAGLPNIISKLKGSHESSLRLFRTMVLDPLEMEERKEVVRKALHSAISSEGVRVHISDDALCFLAELSEGYPHFVQQFAHCAFEHDSDYLIDRDDVGAGAMKEGGAFEQLGDRFFRNMYNSTKTSPEYRKLLFTIAKHGDNWVSRGILRVESNLSDQKLSSALKALKSKGVILSDEVRRGYYKLPNKSFSVWINGSNGFEHSSQFRMRD